ncbi:MAG TPA: histidine phosphatase family protein [Pseudolysinimonas sp.]|nr:histidine phosphatase family protein [Pseudolysinimonas sp.]
MPADLIHLVRHGEVHNPRGVLYGRLPGFGLSDRGHRMAALAADSLVGHPVTALWASPLQRTRESAAPWVERFGAHTGELVIDDRLIEPHNRFEGVNIRRELRRRPLVARWLINPLRPSWGEPFTLIVARMMAALDDAEASVERGEVVVVTHQLPIWMVARTVQGKRLASDPRRRRCSLSSITTVARRGGHFVEVDYQEPARELLAEAIDLGAV